MTGAQSDLSTSKSDGQGTAVPGQAVTYTMTVANAGPQAAAGASVSDVVPANLQGATWTCSASAGSSCAPSGAGNIDDIVNVLVGGTLTYTLSATIAPAATGSLVNTITVIAPPGWSDPNPANDSATDTDTLTPRADLAVTVLDAPDPVFVGSTLTYTVQVANNGPSTSTGMTVVDVLPPGVTFVSSTPGAPTCGRSASIVTCSLTGGLAPAASTTVTITVTSPSSTGTLTNTASATGSEADPVSANDSDSEDTLVVPPLGFFAIPPCRVVDTRGGAPLGGPPLQGQQTRVFPVAGICGIPATAKALSINLTVTQPGAAGHVTLFPAGEPVPTVSSINYTSGRTRANNAIVLVNASTEFAAFAGQASGTTVHFIVDVNGYFE